jgi:protein HIRA/HIR1
MVCQSGTAESKWGSGIDHAFFLIDRNMMTRKALFAPVSMLQLVQSGIEGGTENETIHQASIRSNGTPLIQLSSGAAYAYDIELQVFVEICSTWWAEHSPYWTRTRASNVSSKNVIAYLETSLNTLRPDIVAAAEAAGGRTKPKWWDDAIPLGHLETRLHACTLLHSPSEYKTFLTTYIRKIADEGYKNKAEQLARDLYGPVT